MQEADCDCVASDHAYDLSSATNCVTRFSAVRRRVCPTSAKMYSQTALMRQRCSDDRAIRAAARLSTMPRHPSLYKQPPWYGAAVTRSWANRVFGAPNPTIMTRVGRAWAFGDDARRDSIRYFALETTLNVSSRHARNRSTRLARQKTGQQSRDIMEYAHPGRCDHLPVRYRYVGAAIGGGGH